MCIFKSDKFKSQIMRDKMWTLLEKNSNQLWILIYFKDNFKGCHK